MGMKGGYASGTGVRAERLDETFIRNVDVISSEEQAALGSARVLVAGCGSVGGSLVESVVRLGATRGVLADPEVFDLSNLNRQACTLADVGRPKAEVLYERAQAINPFFEARVLPEGLTEENLVTALDGVTVVFDAIDAAASPWVKYRLHEMAAVRRIPVIAGFDFGGKACLYIFDYRARRTKPFYGRASAEAHREGDLAKCVKWLGYRHFPTDFLGVIRDRMGSGEPWPQVSYCVMAMGALAARSIVELSMRRRLPHVVSLDVHDAFRRPGQKLVQRLRFPLALISAYRASKKGPARAHNAASPQPLNPHIIHNDFALRRVLEAMVRAPSPHNCQPWRFVIVSSTEIQIGWSATRAIPVVDPDHFAIAYSLGCAIEAAASVADIEFVPAPAAPFEACSYVAGTIYIRSLTASRYVRGFGLLKHRATHRGPLLEVPFSHELSERCDQMARAVGGRAIMQNCEGDLLATLAREGAKNHFRRRDYVEELLAHMRLSRAEAATSPTGFTTQSLRLSPLEAGLLRVLRRWPRVRRPLTFLGLSAMMTRSAVDGIAGHRTYVLLTASQWSDSGRVNAGRALMRVWLELTSHGLHCQPVDFPISTNTGRALVAQMFGMPDGERPIALLRVGRATSIPPRSPRLPFAAFCEMHRTADTIGRLETLS